MKTRVDFFIDTKQYLYYASCIHAGLFTLASRGEIELRYRYPKTEQEQDLVADPLAVCLKIWQDDPTRGRLLAIETHDKSDYFAEKALEHCDLYLKRSFYPPDLARFPKSLAEKVQPLGLNYYCRNWASTIGVLKTLGPRLTVKGPTGLRTLYHFLVLPKVAAFEQLPNSAIEPSIVFQTRVWEAHEVGVGDTTINEERVALIRALKSAFGDRFRGGLVPTPFALANYPAEITTLPTRRSHYTQWSKKCLIGIYTRGLHQSIAAKLPECLAASQCLVAEPIQHLLPIPLQEGRNYLGFQNPDQCIAACRRLLEDNALSNSMRQANHEYYRQEVEPAAHAMRNIVRFMDA